MSCAALLCPKQWVAPAMKAPHQDLAAEAPAAYPEGSRPASASSSARSTGSGNAKAPTPATLLPSLTHRRLPPGTESHRERGLEYKGDPNKTDGCPCIRSCVLYTYVPTVHDIRGTTAARCRGVRSGTQECQGLPRPLPQHGSHHAKTYPRNRTHGLGLALPRLCLSMSCIT
jgi:hypothetical protein